MSDCSSIHAIWKSTASVFRLTECIAVWLVLRAGPGCCDGGGAGHSHRMSLAGPRAACRLDMPASPRKGPIKNVVKTLCLLQEISMQIKTKPVVRSLLEEDNMQEHNKSTKHQMAWVERHLKDYPVPNLCCGLGAPHQLWLPWPWVPPAVGHPKLWAACSKRRGMFIFKSTQT